MIQYPWLFSIGIFMIAGGASECSRLMIQQSFGWAWAYAGMGALGCILLTISIRAA